MRVSDLAELQDGELPFPAGTLQLVQLGHRFIQPEGVQQVELKEWFKVAGKGEVGSVCSGGGFENFMESGLGAFSSYRVHWIRL